MSPFEREYDADELIRLCREHDGLSTRELADLMNANYETTRSRCLKLEKEGRLTYALFGFGRNREQVWYPNE